MGWCMSPLSIRESFAFTLVLCTCLIGLWMFVSGVVSLLYFRIREHTLRLRDAELIGLILSLETAKWSKGEGSFWVVFDLKSGFGWSSRFDVVWLWKFSSSEEIPNPGVLSGPSELGLGRILEDCVGLPVPDSRSRAVKRSVIGGVCFSFVGVNVYAGVARAGSFTLTRVIAFVATGIWFVLGGCYFFVSFLSLTKLDSRVFSVALIQVECVEYCKV